MAGESKEEKGNLYGRKMYMNLDVVRSVGDEDDEVSGEVEDVVIILN
jgi:hypothetical protein